MRAISIPIRVESEDPEQLLEHEMYDTPEKDVLVLNYTMACPLSCDFCCYGCHPKRKEKMPLEAAKSLVSQAAAMPNFTSVGLTGGEVFMFEDELVELSAHIHQCGLSFTVATAAHWATDPETARILARKLVANGLKRANVSCDHSHAAFVPRENVVHAANAFAELQVPVYIVGTFADKVSSLESFVPELLDKPFIFLRTKRVAKTGRAKKAEVEYELSETLSLDKTCYRRRHHDLVVFWDGQVYPCCSTFNRATKGLSIGNAFSTPLADIWKQLEYSSLFRIMKSTGFREIIEILDKYNPELAARLPGLGTFPGACSYCNAVFSSEQMTQDIREIFAEYEADTLAAAYDELAVLLGGDNVAHLFKQFSAGAAMETSHEHRI